MYMATRLTDFRSSPEFQQGCTGERRVAEELQRRGWYIVPSYDYSGADGDKAPRLQGLKISYVIPDLDGAKLGERRWFEVKTKTAATFTRVSQRHEHGISRKHYESYKRVEQITGTPVWLVIYELSTDEILWCPLDRLPTPRVSTMRKLGDPGEDMVYFPRSAFRQLA